MLARPPRISVITPVYNMGAYLHDAIESVRAQTYPDWELLIADDASTDDSLAIARKYAAKDARIKVVILPANSRGAARPRNAALSHARGRYVAFLDADDMWLPEKLSQQVDFMKTRGSAVSCTGFRLMNPDGAPRDDLRLGEARIDMSLLLKRPNLCLSSSMIDTHKTGGIRFDERVPVEDFDLWVRLVKNHDIHRLPDELVHYRRGHKSLSSRPLATVFNQFGKHYHLAKQVGARPAARAFARTMTAIALRTPAFVINRLRL